MSVKVTYCWASMPPESLVRFSRQIEVPHWVYAGAGTLGQPFVFLTPEQVELCIRNWVWNHCYWTGTNDPPIPPKDEVRANQILSWWIANRDANGGKGPAMACGTIQNLYIGLLGSMEIKARKINASSASGLVDNSSEYWSSAKSGWVHVIPQTMGHFERHNTPLSYVEWSRLERAYGRDEKFYYVSPFAEGGAPKWPIPGLQPGWVGMTDTAVLENGNALHLDAPHSPYQLVQIWGPTQRQNAEVGNVMPTTIEDLEPLL